MKQFVESLAGAFAILLLPLGVCHALEPAAIAGEWQVLWPNNTRNQMSISWNGKSYVGTYRSDDGSVCSLGGNTDSGTKTIAFQVQCSTWGVRMEGMVAADGHSIQGKYYAYVNSTGSFRMDRR
jgi:hypothetical protein